MPSTVERMKNLLSTGEHSDVHFLLLLAHQLILKNTSDVFEAMFRFDAKKERAENASANCPVVEVSDVEAAAFKVMLSFIYADDVDELDGDNAMGVLYAAKKYNIPDLVDISLQFPISELRNVFLAYAQALLFELEDFANKCLRYICQNAAQLFGSDEFLQIDQKMLCGLLDSDRLLLSDELEMHSVGPMKNVFRMALNAPQKIVVQHLVRHFPSDVLTEKEVIGVYQFNSHPFLHLRGVPGLYSLKFPSHGRISDWNKAKGNRKWTLGLEIEKNVRCPNLRERRLRAVEGPSDRVFSATYRIVSEEKNGAKKSIGKLYDCVIDSYSVNGFGNLISLAELMDPSNGFYNGEEDKVILAIDVTVKDEKTEKFVSDRSKSKGTLSMEIEKVSEFRREVFESERKSETVHIKAFPWKIWAQIKKKKGNADNDEKWLDIYLLFDASTEEDENWSCKCSATFRIVSQKNGVTDFRRELKDNVFDNKENSCYWAHAYSIAFAELMDPKKGFYNKSEDKVTLAIDVTDDEKRKNIHPHGYPTFGICNLGTRAARNYGLRVTDYGNYGLFGVTDYGQNATIRQLSQMSTIRQLNDSSTRRFVNSAKMRRFVNSAKCQRFVNLTIRQLDDSSTQPKCDDSSTLSKNYFEKQFP
ncbi:hypothetical protein niasHT_019044 [Heterodera trifolii]|uniref:BTB domain-containing protein n=1 Tax=Heterodera trifolii TaxID=157864 RepID=A0ABD2LHM9_9BILA